MLVGQTVGAGCGIIEGNAGERRRIPWVLLLLFHHFCVRQERPMEACLGFVKGDEGGKRGLPRCLHLRCGHERMRKGGQWRQAVSLLREMQEDRVRGPVEVGFKAAIDACESNDEHVLASELSQEMILSTSERTRLPGMFDEDSS